MKVRTSVLLVLAIVGIWVFTQVYEGEQRSEVKDPLVERVALVGTTYANGGRTMGVHHIGGLGPKAFESTSTITRYEQTGVVRRGETIFIDSRAEAVPIAFACHVKINGNPVAPLIQRFSLQHINCKFVVP
jgi:hypothetical protein